MGGKGSAPKAPDYVGAANAQAEASKEVTNIQNFANRPTINTPYGSESWSNQASIDPATGQRVTSWTQNTTLAPGLQAALDAQVGTQLGRSNLANDFMGRVANEYSQPFDYENLPQMAQMGGAPSLYTGLADYAQGLSTGVNSRSGDVVGGFGFGGPQMGVQDYGLNTQFDPMQGGLARNVQQQDVQRQLNMGDNPALPQFDSSYRDSVAQSLIERMMPVHDRQRNEIETQLANSGYTVGSEGYTRALADMQGRQAAERYNALDTAGNEAQRLYGMQMGSRQQAFNEDMGMGQFANSAANQAFQQSLGANQFQNQATGQAYQQAMGAQQAGNQALGQQFGQGLQAGQFGNQAQNQLYQQMMGQANLANQANAQAFQQDLAANQFGNQSLGQAAALDQSRMGAMNQAMTQQFGMNQQFANQQNQLRQQAIAEQMQRRGMSLNEMNALLSGQQVNMPQMPNFVQAGRSETPDILGATQMGYNAQMDAYNAKQAQFGQLLNAGTQLGSAFMFSDRRLKRDLKRVGTHAIGVGIYDYTMLGFPQRGVIAQEVQKVRPDLVARHANGYLTVNYGGL